MAQWRSEARPQVEHLFLQCTTVLERYSEKKSVFWQIRLAQCLFVCVEVLRPSQPSGVMSSAVGLPNHTFTGQA